MVEENNLVTYLLTYLSYYKNKNKNKNRYNTTLRINPEIYEKFTLICTKLFQCHKKSPNSGINLIIEALLDLVNQKLERQPEIIQTTLIYKPTFQKIEVNIATKLELKLIQKELYTIIQHLNSNDLKTIQKKFWLNELKKQLPKAIRLFTQTNNKELEILLKKSEQYV